MAETNANQRRAVDNLTVGIGEAYTVKSLCATTELAAAAIGDTIVFGRIPASARILLSSRFYNDDCAAAGAPTLDIGLFNVNSNITDDDDALNNGIDLASAGSDLLVLSDHANGGKRAWVLVDGQEDDPRGEFIVKGTIKDAVTDQTGSLTLDLYYVID